VRSGGIGEGDIKQSVAREELQIANRRRGSAGSARGDYNKPNRKREKDTEGAWTIGMRRAHRKVKD